MNLGYYALLSQTHFTWSAITDQTLSHKIPGKGGFSFYNIRDQKFINVKNRKLRRLNKFVDFFHSNQLFIGDTGFLEQTGNSKQPNTIIFPHLQIGNHHYPTYVQGMKTLSVPLVDFSRITIISGLCLFGFEALYAIARDRTKVNVLSQHIVKQESPLEHFFYDPHPSFYEMECITRLTRFISDLVSILPTSIPCRLRFSIPRVQYYLYLLPLLENNVISYDLFNQWIELVDIRHKSIKRVIKIMMQSFLQDQHHVVMPSIAFTDEYSDGLFQRMVQFIAAQKIPTLEELTYHLRDQDTLWKLICDIDPPQTYHDLSYRSYVIEFLRYSLQHKSSPPEFVFQIDNPAEKKIYRNAKEYARILKSKYPDKYQLYLTGLYPLEMIFRTQGHTNLFYQEFPSNLVDLEGNTYTKFSLLEKMYGTSHHSLIEENFPTPIRIDDI